MKRKWGAIALCLIILAASGRGVAESGKTAPKLKNPGRPTPSFWIGAYLFGKLDVDFRQMKDSLHLNIIQISTGFADSATDARVFMNPYFPILDQRKVLNDLSRAQRAVFTPPQAGKTAPVTADEQTAPPIPGSTSMAGEARGVLGVASEGQGGNSVVVETGREAAISSDPRFTNTRFYATFHFRASSSHTQVPQGPIVELEVQCKGRGTLAHVTLNGESVRQTGNEMTAAVPFTIGRSPSDRCNEIQLRASWDRNRDMTLDSIVVEDETAYRLFRHEYDAEMDREIRTASGAPAHGSFYLVDEPSPYSFDSFRYVKDRISHVLGSREAAGTTSAAFEGFNRFLQRTGASSMMIDAYFLTSDLPHPSLAHNNEAAGASGIDAWDSGKYLEGLQKKIDEYLSSRLRRGAEAAVAQRSRLVQVVQVHGIAYKATGNYRASHGGASLRPPSPSELRLQCGLGIAYGAKGIFYYPYGTDADKESVMPGFVMPGQDKDPVDGRSYDMRHDANVWPLVRQPIWAGYAEKWDEAARLNKRLGELGKRLSQLTWQGAKSWSSGLTAGHWAGLVSALATAASGQEDSKTFVEVGHFRAKGAKSADYLVVVNRRCADDDARTVKLSLRKGKLGALRVRNLESGKTWNIQNGSSFTDTIGPGDLQVYEVK